MDKAELCNYASKEIGRILSETQDVCLQLNDVKAGRIVLSGIIAGLFIMCEDNDIDLKDIIKEALTKVQQYRQFLQVIDSKKVN